jgi:ubiquinone/menaquinone biosynthesis C-methylase UbiE
VVAGRKASRLMPMDTPIVDGDPDAPVSKSADALSEERYLPGMSTNWLLPLYDPLVRMLGIESHHRRLVELAAFEAGERVLEIGCGTGNLTLLIKRLHPKADVVGIDPDDKALSRARRKADRRHLAVRFDYGFAQRLPYSDGSLDRVVSAFMLHHLDADVKRAVLVEALRVLMHDGRLLLVDFGGAIERSDGWMARLQHRNKHLAGNHGQRIPELMREVGFEDAGEIGHRVTHLGRITFYGATVSRTPPMPHAPA